MDPKTLSRWAAALTALALIAAPAMAQTVSSKSASGPKTASSTTKVSTSATVMAVDVASRHVAVKTASGDVTTLKVPPDIKAISNLKPGDKITATYVREVAYAVSEPGKPLPKNAATLVAGRAGQGELPAGVAATHIVVTGSVVGINTAKSTLKVVNPKGGEVHDFDVVTPEGKALLAKLKVGDKITADVTEALLLTVDRG